ncbi:MAG TPA: ribonuclease H [Polyangiaceae bacterium]|nr:ribonuclease H [Polyangiaceae bacterium]
MSDLVAFTDGGCRGNPGIGAWAFVLVDIKTRKALERAGGDALTTNNRMELSALLEALLAVKNPGASILVVSDSKYTIDCCSKWMPGWKKNGWKRKGDPLKNLDLLQSLDVQLARHQVKFAWVAGHSGHPGNEHVDRLGNEAMDRLAVGGDPAHERRFEWTEALR